MKAVLLHLSLTLVWSFLHGNPTIGGFILGGIGSFILLWAFKKVLQCEEYVRRVFSLLSFTLFFLRTVLRDNVNMARLCLTPDISKLDGNFTRYDVSDLTQTETTLLAHLINLSPGTTVADLSDDGHFILHSFPAADASKLQQYINETLKARLLAITR